MRNLANNIGLVDGIFSLNLIYFYLKKLPKNYQYQITNKANEIRLLIEKELKESLGDNYYEDTAVEVILKVLKKLGWDAKDKRSTPLPQENSLKPDIWLDSHKSYCEVVARSSDDSMTSEFEGHTKRTTFKYCNQAKSHSCIVSDGRSWLITSSLKEFEGTYFFIDFKKYYDIKFYRAFVFLFSPNSPIISSKRRQQITNLKPINKKLFLNRVIKTFLKICHRSQNKDLWKDLFAYSVANLYAEHNHVFKTSYNNCFLEIASKLTTSNSKIVSIFWKNVKEVAEKTNKENNPLIDLAIRLKKGKSKFDESDIMILLKALILPDSNNYYIGWQDLNSDDLSQIYELALKGDRKSDGIYATPIQLAEEIIY